MAPEVSSCHVRQHLSTQGLHKGETYRVVYLCQTMVQSFHLISSTLIHYESTSVELNTMGESLTCR
jgi:hypothetical protein